eukprot:421558-Prymnesium_polylepis.1
MSKWVIMKRVGRIALNHLHYDSYDPESERGARARLGRARCSRLGNTSTRSDLSPQRCSKMQVGVAVDVAVEPQPLFHPHDESSGWLAAQLKAHDRIGARARTCGVRRAACGGASGDAGARGGARAIA